MRKLLTKQKGATFDMKNIVAFVALIHGKSVTLQAKVCVI